METQWILVVCWDVSLFSTLHANVGPEPTEYVFFNEKIAMQAYTEIRNTKNKYMRAQSMQLHKRECLILE
jgi:hypothetical protein